MDKHMRIYLSDILYLVKKKWKFVLIMTLIGLVTGCVFQGFIILRGNISKSYNITASAVFLTQYENGNYPSENGKSDRNTYLLSEDMSQSVMYVLQSQKLMDYVVKKMNISDIKSKNIKSNLTVTQHEESPVFKFSLSWRNAEEGKQIMNSILINATPVMRSILGMGSMSVVESPKATRVIVGGSSANIIFITAIGFLIGIFILILELLYNATVINVDIVEKELDLQLLSVISKDSSSDGSERKKSYEALTYVLMNKIRETGHPILYVTSVMNGEGKTATAVGLAKHLSKLEKNVLLIDLDVNGPAIGTYFEGTDQYAHSLNALFKGEIFPEDAIVNVSGYLDVMPTMLEYDSFSIEPDMLNVISDFSGKYDYTIIDAPALSNSTDALMINQIADHALFVIGFDMAQKKDIREGIKTLRESGADIIGCVLTKEVSVDIQNTIPRRKESVVKNVKKQKAVESTTSYKLMNILYGASDKNDKSDEQTMSELIEYGLNDDDDGDISY